MKSIIPIYKKNNFRNKKSKIETQNKVEIKEQMQKQRSRVDNKINL